MPRSLWVLLAVGALTGCHCSDPANVDPDAGSVDAGRGCELDTDCALAETCVNHRCGRPSSLDSGTLACESNADCPAGQQCLPSTKTCFTPQQEDAGELDAGFLGACLPGQVQSCGSSKFGECKLGTSECVLVDGGWLWGACFGAVEPVAEVCNGKDDDCDGLVDDGLGDTTCGQGECTRTVSACLGGQVVACTPGPPSAEVCDGKDNDCDGQTDEGLTDLACGTGECARTAPACVNGAAGTCTPGSPTAESCNGKDDDCDGTPDDGLGTTSCGLGVCARSAPSCINGVPNACTPGTAGPELCNGLDDNCNGTTDEGCACTDGQTQSCYSGPPGTSGIGPCKTGSQLCAGGAWGACVGQVVPASETCNGVDDNCNNQTDEGLGQATCGVGACLRTVNKCQGGVPQTCTPGTAIPEICNGLDDNCNGQTDELLPTISCGVGVCRVTVAGCVAGAAATCTPGTPGTEVCNGLDDNCNGTADETFPQQGQSCATGVPGKCAAGQWACGSGTLTCAQTVLPVPEVCNNGLDENCNGLIDDPISCGCNSALDKDLDGTNECLDCNDNDGTIHPGAVEKCNGKDDNCVGGIDEGFDVDNDGFTTCGTKAGGGLDPMRVDCNDNNGFVFPLKTTDCGAAATPTTANGVDDNCNGYLDETCACTATDRDNDGVTSCAGDCNDNDATVFPGHPEVCDGKDNDCNKATVDNCGVSDPCGYKQGASWNPWPAGTDSCRADLVCVSNISTGALSCGSFCNQTTGQGLNDSCANNEGCFRNLIDSDNQHLCSVLTVGASTTGQTCTVASSCRSGDCLTDGTVKYCSDKCTHEAGCSGNTTCYLQQDPVTSGPMVIGHYNFSYCRLDSQISGVKTPGQACTAGSTECHTGALGCLNGTCVAPCCTNSDCAAGSSCSINGPKSNIGYTTGGASITSVVPVCVVSAATRIAGQACTTSAQCRSGICDSTLGICIDVCCNDSTCPNATTCEPLQLKLSTGEVTTARLCVFSPVPARIDQK